MVCWAICSTCTSGEQNLQLTELALKLSWSRGGGIATARVPVEWAPGQTLPVGSQCEPQAGLRESEAWWMRRPPSRDRPLVTGTYPSLHHSTTDSAKSRKTSQCQEGTRVSPAANRDACWCRSRRGKPPRGGKVMNSVGLSLPEEMSVT